MREGGSGHVEVGKSIEREPSQAKPPVAANSDLASSSPFMLSMLILTLHN